MRWSATKLRWLLLSGFVLLAVVVAGFFSVARYRAGLIWQRILARNGVNLQRETNGFTYSQSSHGRTVFTLHASKAKPEGKNKWMLQDAVLILYGREPGRDDRIYGKQFEYDQDAGVARALGEVHMDLQTPEPGGKPPAAGTVPALTFGPESETGSDPGLIHVRTSGLVYMRKLGVAATGQPAEFRYAGITCTSKGAEFDTAHNAVRLLADVHLTGVVRNGPFTLSAAHAELYQENYTANLNGAVLISGDRSARASQAVLHLRKDGSLEALEASGSVELHRGTETMAAPQMTAVFGAENRPQRARLFSGVRFADSDAAKPAQGGARTVDLSWLPDGALSTVDAVGQVRLMQSGTGREGGAVQRQLGAEHALATFAPSVSGGKRAILRRLDMSGNAQGQQVARTGAAGTPRETAIQADRLTTDFLPGADGRAEAEAVHGMGHTRLEQAQENGAHQVSTGETLEIRFGPRGSGRSSANAVVSAVQTGHVEVQSLSAPKPPATAAAGSAPELTTGHADRAEFAQVDNTLTLLGADHAKATFQQSGGEISGGTIVLHEGTGDAEFSGGVVATSLGRDASPATHILAARARLLHASKLSIFSGDNEHPAQLWQGGSQVQAAEITLDGKTHGLAARPATDGGVVQAFFAADGKPKESARKVASPSAIPEGKSQARLGGDTTPAARDAVRVQAEKMDYDDQGRAAVFGGNVRVTGVTGDVSSDRGTAFLKPAEVQGRPHGAASTEQGNVQGAAPALSGSLDRIVLMGDVRLVQPGRSGTGEQLTYTADTDSFVLTGSAAKPPRVTGEQGSVVTGATLLFRNDDNTVVVAGAKGEHKPGAPARVHVETNLK